MIGSLGTGVKRITTVCIYKNPEFTLLHHDIDKTHHFRACHPSWTGWGGLGFPDCADSPVID